MSVAQIAQRILHHARDARDPSQVHDFALAKELLREEGEDILRRLQATIRNDRDRASYAEAEERYRKAMKIAMRWIKNYTELNFRSLGSYTSADLETIAAADDAF